MDRRVIGRAPELERIDRLLRDARSSRAGVLALEGESGVGKTSLLRAAAARAGEFTCLTARGIESEAALAHACLLELLTPVRAHLDAVPRQQAAALAAALGWGPVVEPGDRFLVGAGALALLAAAAERAPVLVLLDDVQWIDAESTAALLFAARRMHRDRVAFVLARRAGGSPALDGVDLVTVADLSVAEAQELLAPGVTGAVVRTLVGRLGGNPLALLEVASRLAPAERKGTAPLPDVLPVGRQLGALFDPQLAGLSSGARRALLLLAASYEGRANAVAAALERSGVAADDALDDAERHHVVVRDGEDLAFRHPLMRSAVWRRATPEQRRAAHRALADSARVGDDVTRTWHRAQAVDGRDDVLADELVAMADRARAQRGFAASSAALERAAELTTDARRSAERLASAVTDASLGGQVARARALATRLLRDHAGAPARGEALHALGVLEQHAGSVLAARDLLSEAAEVADGVPRTRALAELALTQHRLGDVPGLARTAERIAQGTDPGSPEGTALAAWVVGVAHLHAGEPVLGRPHVRRALELMESEPSLVDEPRLLLFIMLGLGWLDDPLSWVPGVERRLRGARERGALGVLVAALSMSAYGRAELLGDHTGAFADAGESVELAEQLGFVADAAPALELLAWEHAARGQHEEARRHLDRARELVARSGTSAVAAHLALSAAFCALCRGDLDETAQILEARLAADGGVGSLGEPLGVAPLLVEAYVGLGRRPDAAALASRYAEVSSSPLPQTAALVARCRALTAGDDEQAVAAFEESLRCHALAPDEFETSRTRLLYGAWLRRAGRRTEAREHLEASARRFGEWDFLHWAQRAEAELRATGRTARPRRLLAEEPLTSQETRIAVLAAQGQSNREIAAMLFLSPKTVEHHLSSVYRKRGLRSRVQLGRAFPTAGG